MISEQEGDIEVGRRGMTDHTESGAIFVTWLTGAVAIFRGGFRLGYGVGGEASVYMSKRGVRTPHPYLPFSVFTRTRR